MSDTLRTILHEKILALVAKYPRYPHDLYDTCARGVSLSRSDFTQLLNKMENEGEIRINSNTLVMMPKSSDETIALSAEPTDPTVKIENSTDEIRIHCLVNRSITLKHPKQKKSLNNLYYAHSNYKTEQIQLNRVCEETLLKGYQFVPGEFKPNPDPDIGIRTAENWCSQQLFLIEFDNTTENTLDEFIAARPFLKENGWLVTESIRSRYDDPDDDTCNGQLRPRLVFCMPRAVKTRDKRKWIYDALVKELPGCDDGSANSITNGGLGKANAKHIKIRKIVDTDWFNAALATGQEKKAEADKAKRERAEERKRKQEERAAMGYTEREGELPLEALAKAEPSLFLQTLGLSLKSESGQYQHWGRTEKQGDTALSVWQSDRGNWQICVFANSISVPQSVSGAMPFTRFYCYHELHTDIEGLQPDSQQWKDINAQLARRGYGTWLTDEEFNAKHATRKNTYLDGIEPITTLPPDHRIITSAPIFETRERSPSYRHFSKEERAIVRDVLSLDPDAGWHGPIPVFTTRYEYLHPLTNKFALNGQPSEVEKRRVWSTLFGNCKICGAVTAKWIDRYLLIAGLYCDGCHKDYALGSYLEWELDRKLPNSIISEYQGFLGDDPEFQDFRLWEPQMLTHLGAGMATGKSTEIYKEMISLAIQRLGKGIIGVPRISLARFLAHLLRHRDGFNAWGLWHEGVRKSDRFIGEYGAIVCLPSLPRAVQCAEDNGVTQLHIAIDELDFSYGLLSLSIEQATAVKKCLLDALNTTGLVVSGQTESTLALEAFASELACEQVQGFYNTAKPADGAVVMHKHANVEGKSTAIVCGAMDDISQLLDEGHNVYVFCSSRRDGDLIEDEFKHYNPVIYNAYTKGTARADAVLRNQRLTDSRLFIGTSAAGVGISILDKKARTVIVNGLNHGSRDASMAVQKCVRDRGRCGVSFHYTDYNLSLPVRPTENEIVSLYHEALKIAENKPSHLPEAGIKKVARAEALASLADHQIETFISHHLGTVGNMPVHQASALRPSEDKIAIISERRRSLIRAERQKKLANAIILLKNRNLLTSFEIRVRSNKGEMSPSQRLAYETANGYACAIGWNDKIDRGAKQPFDEFLDDTDITIAIALAEKNINVDKLAKQRRGYIAVNFPNWTADAFQTALANTESDLVDKGLGIESTAIHDDRFRGELLQALLNRLAGTVFDVSSLASAVHEVLKQNRTNGQTFIGEIHRGALGGSEYRKARFLAYADDDRVVDWASQFVSEWYPARIQKREDHFALTHAENLDLRLASFQRWLIHQSSPPDNMPTDLDISFQSTELPAPDAELKTIAQFRRESGETIKSIADSLKRHVNTVSKWCEGINPPSPAEAKVLSILSNGQVWKTPDIVKHSGFTHQHISITLKKLVDTGAISRIKRGHYQKK